MDGTGSHLSSRSITITFGFDAVARASAVFNTTENHGSRSVRSEIAIFRIVTSNSAGYADGVLVRIASVGERHALRRDGRSEPRFADLAAEQKGFPIGIPQHRLMAEHDVAAAPRNALCAARSDVNPFAMVRGVTTFMPAIIRRAAWPYEG